MLTLAALAAAFWVGWWVGALAAARRLRDERDAWEAQAKRLQAERAALVRALAAARRRDAEASAVVREAEQIVEEAWR